MSDMERKIREWHTAGLINEDQVTSIQAHEGWADAPEPPDGGEVTGVSAAVEAVGYLGGAMAVAAAFFFMSGVIPDLSEAGQVGLAGLLTVVFFVAGALVRKSSAPGRRLKSVLWAASVLGTATTAGLLATGLFDAEAAAVAFSASASALVIAGITWMLNKSALGNVILLLAIIASATSLIAVINDNTHSSFYGLAVWAIGVAWTILSWAGYTPPSRPGMVVGSAAALVGAQMTATEPYRPQGLTLAVITVILILVSGARLGRIGLLITGAIGVVVFSVQVAQELFGGSELAVAVALVVVAALLVIGAVAASRRRKVEVL
jgi:hypothetical protein